MLELHNQKTKKRNDIQAEHKPPIIHTLKSTNCGLEKFWFFKHIAKRIGQQWSKHYHPGAVSCVSTILNELLARGWWGFHGIQTCVRADFIKFPRLFSRNVNVSILARGEWSSRWCVRQQIRMDAEPWLVYWSRISENRRRMVWLDIHGSQITR